MKRLIQSFLARRGYRIVARARDPQSAMDVVFAHPVDAVIDVGANRGDTCLEWLKRFPRAKVHAFEPLPDMAQLVRTRTAPWAERMRIFQIAASDAKGEATFVVHTDHPSSSSLRAPTDTAAELMPFTAVTSEIAVAVDTLDNVLGTDGPAFSEALLKLDVQGHELTVLQGARAILPSVRYVLTEVNLRPLYEGQPTFGQLNAFLSEQGFDFIGVTEQFHLESGSPIFLDALFERIR